MKCKKQFNHKVFLKDKCSRKATISPVLAVNDVIQALNVYAGKLFFGPRVVSADLDTNGSPAIVIDIGYGNNTTATGANSTVKMVQLLLKVVVSSSTVH